MSDHDPLAAFRLDDRLIVVTGASEGIGRAFAVSFACAGARVVLASRHRDKLDDVRQTIGKFGGQAEVVPTDVTRLDDIRALAKHLKRARSNLMFELMSEHRASQFIENEWKRLASVAA